MLKTSLTLNAIFIWFVLFSCELYDLYDLKTKLRLIFDGKEQPIYTKKLATQSMVTQNKITDATLADVKAEKKTWIHIQYKTQLRCKK